jgi:GntR family transcriptional regulator
MTNRPLKRQSPQPRGNRSRAAKTEVKPSTRYRHIADTLAADISAGRYKVGGLLPSEAEFCDRFVASRHTVREALRILTRNGMIIRRAGAGSTVVATSQRMVLVPNVGTVEPVLNFPTVVVRKPLKSGFIQADDQVAQLLQCAPGTPWFKLSEVRFSDRTATLPSTAIDVFVLPEYSTVRTHKSYLTIPVHLQIERMFGCSLGHAEVSIFAGRIPPELAPVLKVAADSPALRLIRRYFDTNGRLFEVAFGTFPEGRYTYTLSYRKEERL